MKKFLIASLIASTSFTAIADETTLYGAVGYTASLGRNTEDTFTGNKGNYKTKASRANLDTDELWWGIKGEENINPNLNAFWKLEFGEKNMRRAYVGLQGDSWGTLTLGTQDSLYKNLTNYNDIFQADTFWNSKTRYDEGLVRPSNTISYVSPNWSGFQFGVAGILNGKDNIIKDNGVGLSNGAKLVKSKNKSFGAGQIGAWYNKDGIYASLAYEYVDGRFGYIKDEGVLFYQGKKNKYGERTLNGKGTQLLGGSVGYKNEQFKIGLTEQHKFKDGDKATLAGEYYYGPNTFRAGFSYANSDLLDAVVGGYTGYNPKTGKSITARNYCKNRTNKCANNVYTYALGYQYNFSKRTYTFVEANLTDWNSKNRKNGYETKVGLRHDF